MNLMSLIDRKIGGAKKLSHKRRSEERKDNRTLHSRSVREAFRDVSPGKRVIVILSLPKCGGCSLQATLRATFTEDFTAHLHVWSTGAMEHLIESECDRGNFGREVTLRHVDIAARLRDYFVASPPAESWWFTGVREPISYVLSLFFEMQVTHSGARSGYGILEIREYIESGQGFFGDPRRFDEWFDKEFLAATGIDVFANHFDRERGYAIVKKEGKSACIYRLESFKVIGHAISETFGVPLKFVRDGVANRSDDKGYADRYRDTLKTIRFSAEFLDQVYGTRYARHFYSDEERARFKAEWIA